MWSAALCCSCGLQALTGSADLPSLFAGLEQEREELDIEDYSLSQTSLEHVFIALARPHEAEDLPAGLPEA